MTSRSLFGLETEYAIAGTLPGGEPMVPEELARGLLGRASAQLKWISSTRAGDLFLENGSRLYVDCGGHPELATPECHDPWEAVRFARAGDRIIAGLASDLEKRYPDGSKVMVFKSNVDYAGARTTWGCHESYMYRSPAHLIADDLIPHLVSRLIYTGAGGFNPMATGIVFSLSPRVTYVRQVESHDSLSQRGILHTRQEALARPPYQRLHLIVGDTASSDLALWLKMGTTALVLAMIDGGLRPGAAVQLEEPVTALRTFAGDPTCRARARLRNGDQASAIDIQRHFLSLAERHRGAWFMPQWADYVCERWRDVLDRLGGAPASVATELDWAIKYALFDDYIRKNGCDWQRLSAATKAVPPATYPTSAGDWVELTDDEDLDDGEDVVLRATVTSANTAPETAVAQALLELDWRFGQIAPAGIFKSLDLVGVLAHRVDGVSDRNIERAMTHPPPRGRARVRGQLVSRLAAQRGAYSCDWSGVWHVASGRWVDLSDPFMEQEQWKEKSGGVHHVST